MNTAHLILTADLSDLWKAASQAPEFRSYLQARGIDASLAGTFLALLNVCPWAYESGTIVPWREVSNAL